MWGGSGGWGDHSGEKKVTERIPHLTWEWADKYNKWSMFTKNVCKNENYQRCVSAFLPPRGEPLFELRQTRTNRERLKQEKPTKNTSSHANKRPQAPMSLKSDLKLPDRHFSTFKVRKSSPTMGPACRQGPWLLLKRFIVPPASGLPRKPKSRRNPGWDRITLHGHTEDSGLRKPIKKATRMATSIFGGSNEAEQKCRGTSRTWARA